MVFYTNTHFFRQMEYSEIRELEAGEKIGICIDYTPRTSLEIRELEAGRQLIIHTNDTVTESKMEFVTATVVRPMFWNSDADEPDWEVETTNGFVDILQYL